MPESSTNKLSQQEQDSQLFQECLRDAAAYTDAFYNLPESKKRARLCPVGGCAYRAYRSAAERFSGGNQQNGCLKLETLQQPEVVNFTVEDL